MWCPEGYVTLVDISVQFNFDVDAVGPAEGRPKFSEDSSLQIDTGLMDADELKAFELWRWAAFFEHLGHHVRACLPSGALVKLSRPALFPWGHLYRAFPKRYAERLKCKEIFFDFIELPGMVKTASDLTKIDWARGIEGASLCIAEQDLPVPIHELTDWLLLASEKHVDEVSTPAIVETDSLAVRIVEAFKSRRVSTKPQAKQMLARDMKWEAWRAEWREAVLLDPDLAKPGPRGSRD